MASREGNIHAHSNISEQNHLQLTLHILCPIFQIAKGSHGFHVMLWFSLYYHSKYLKVKNLHTKKSFSTVFSRLLCVCVSWWNHERLNDIEFWHSVCTGRSTRAARKRKTISDVSSKYSTPYSVTHLCLCLWSVWSSEYSLSYLSWKHAKTSIVFC